MLPWILHIIKAIALANGTPYALAAGVFSQVSAVSQVQSSAHTCGSVLVMFYLLPYASPIYSTDYKDRASCQRVAQRLNAVQLLFRYERYKGSVKRLNAVQRLFRYERCKGSVTKTVRASNPHFQRLAGLFLVLSRLNEILGRFGMTAWLENFE